MRDCECSRVEGGGNVRTRCVSAPDQAVAQFQGSASRSEGRPRIGSPNGDGQLREHLGIPVADCGTRPVAAN